MTDQRRAEVRVHYVGEKGSYSLTAGHQLDFYAGLARYLNELSTIPVLLEHWEESEIGIGDLPDLANCDLVVVNWSKVAFVLAQFLRRECSSNAKLVLYSGVILDPRNPRVRLTVPMPIERGQGGNAVLDLGLSSEKIVAFGIFDYFISKEQVAWSAHSWEQVIEELDSKAPNREPLKPENCVPYFAYRWPKYEFRDHSSHAYITSEGYDHWYEAPLARLYCLKRFEEHFLSDMARAEMGDGE